MEIYNIILDEPIEIQNFMVIDVEQIVDIEKKGHEFYLYTETVDEFIIGLN